MSKQISKPENPVRIDRRFATAATPLTAETVKPYVETIREAATSADRAVGLVMFDAALLLHRLHETKSIGKGGAFESQNDYARAIGVSKGYASRLRALGMAAVTHKVDAGTPAWSFLTRHAADAKVKAVLSGEPDALHGYQPEGADGVEQYAPKRLIDLWAAEEVAGNYRATDKPRQIKPGQSDAEAKDSGAPEVVESVEPTMAEVLAWLDKNVKDLSREDWASVENRLNAIITRENTVRAKQAEQAAKPKRTRKSA